LQTGKGKYREWLEPDGLTRLEGLARSGLTDAQIAAKIGINVCTLYDWQNRFPDITNALKRGKAPVDDEVEMALLKRARGFTTTETIEEITTSGEKDDFGNYKVKERHIRKITREIPPETAAGIFWLKNRRPEKWRDKPAEVEDTGTMEKLDQMLSEVWSYAANAKTS